MKLKSILLVIAMFSGLFAISQPQDGQRRQFNREEMVKRQTEDMVKELGLDEAQILKVTELNEKYGKKMGEAFQQAGEDRLSMREAIKTIRNDKDVELKEILTPEQFKKYQEMEEKRREERRERMEERRKNSPERRGKPRGNEN